MSLSTKHPAVNAALVEYWWSGEHSLGSSAAYNKITKEWDCQLVGDVGCVYLKFNNPANETAFLLRYS
ncbi:MAG: hypothetical protein RLY43_402 [Bacteroidota bacterium]|jgi:hypothetical protein